MEVDPMSIDHLEAFVFVNHFGSVNKAAKALFLSQPTVTARIQSLEREMDVKLFDRVGKRLVMTDAAKEFLPYAESIIQSYKSGRKRIQERSATDQLVIGCTGLVSNYFISKILPKFRSVHPNLHIKLITATTEEIENKVKSREVDIGFVRSSSDPFIESHPILESPIRLFVTASHPFTERHPIDVEDLAKEPIVFYECGSLDWTTIKKLFHHLHHRPNIAYEVDSLEAAKQLILHDGGAGFLPEISVRKEVASGELRMIDLPIVENVSLKTKIIYYRGEKPNHFDEIFQLVEEEGKVTL